MLKIWEKRHMHEKLNNITFKMKIQENKRLNIGQWWQVVTIVISAGCHFGGKKWLPVLGSGSVHMAQVMDDGGPVCKNFLHDLHFVS